jgi:AraC-like DNA-binding protein
MDLLSDILSNMRLNGTLYFRTSFTSPWAIQVPAYSDVARFHFAWKGRCFVRVEGARDPVSLEQGDLIIITRGAAHRMYCDPVTERHCVLLDEVITRSGFDGHGALVYGDSGTGHDTQLVCGHFAFDPAVTHPVIDALPAHIHIRNYGEAAGEWMESTLRVIGAEAGRHKLGGDLIALKLSEIVFAQALRSYLASDGAARPVLAAFADPGISRVLAAIHERPAEPWALDAMAGIAGMSRTSFAAKFSERMSMTPYAYVTHWRMQLARKALAETLRPVIEIALSVGYRSEAAFGRVFKKQFGIAPATFRRMRTGRQGAAGAPAPEQRAGV